MNFLIWIVVGGLIGWVASMVMKTDAQQGLFLNLIVGIVGAFLGRIIDLTPGWRADHQPERLQFGRPAGVAARRHHPARDRQLGASWQGPLISA